MENKSNDQSDQQKNPTGNPPVHEKSVDDKQSENEQKNKPDDRKPYSGNRSGSDSGNPNNK